MFTPTANGIHISEDIARLSNGHTGLSWCLNTKDKYHINSAINQGFLLQNSSKNLDPSYKIFETALEEKKPSYSRIAKENLIFGSFHRKKNPG